MKKSFIFLSIILISLGVVLNLKTTSGQCIDYQCRSIEMPLYLKAINFLDRHYNYKQLVKAITAGCRNDEERAIKILEWTYFNIRKPPKDFPVIDDHAWYIIIRGYGTEDQSQDVFTTLCNYVKINASFYKVKNSRYLSLAKIDNTWTVIDAHAGAYFRNKEGRIAGIKDLLNGNWRVVSIAKGGIAEDYSVYFSDLASLDHSGWQFMRSAIQSPIRRFIYWIKTKD